VVGDNWVGHAPDQSEAESLTSDLKGVRRAGDLSVPRFPRACCDCYLLSVTLIASTSLSIVRNSYVTLASLGSVVMSPGMLLLCTKRFPPSLGTIQPYPLSASKVLTIPFFKRKTPPQALMNEGQRGAGTQTRFQRSG